MSHDQAVVLGADGKNARERAVAGQAPKAILERIDALGPASPA